MILVGLLGGLLRSRLTRFLAIHSIGDDDEAKRAAANFARSLEIRLDFDTRSFDRSLARAGDAIERAAARALTRASFDVRDALLREAEGGFDLTARGRTLLAGRTAWKLTAARPDSLFATIEARPATGAILVKHARGATIFPGADADSLLADAKIAIPVIPRGGSGRVPKRLEPVAVRAPGGRGFVAKGLVLQRVGRRRSRALRVLYTLASRVRIPRRFRFEEVVRDTARTAVPAKVRREIEKLRLR
jgi:hypothetical protein